MLGETLEEVTESKYLGVVIQNDLKWDKQTNHAAAKATKMLNFIKRNFYQCSKTVKKNLYQTLVQPHLEYASAAWNPGTNKNQDILQKVQRKAARFVHNDFSSESSVNKMLTELGWDSIETRRKIQRLTTLHKILYHDLDLDIDLYTKQKVARSRRSHNKQFETKHYTSTKFFQSFFPETTRLWNSLPPSCVATNRAKVFRNSVQDFYRLMC